MISPYQKLVGIFDDNRAVVLTFFSTYYVAEIVRWRGGRADVGVALVLALVMVLWLNIMTWLHAYTARQARVSPMWGRALDKYASLMSLLLVFVLTSYSLELLNTARRNLSMSVAEMIVFPLFLLLMVTTQSVLIERASAVMEALHAEAAAAPAAPAGAPH